jgi:uncharacterized protein (DUF1919 family)
MNSLFLKIADWVQRRIKSNYLRKHQSLLRVKNFTVISKNCWGGILYQDLKLPYQTPFVNMFMFADCYLKLVKNFEAYMQIELQVSDKSRYLKQPANYPIGHLNDVEIHFIHYTSQDPVIEMWSRRRDRINYKNLFFVLSERDGCQPHHISEFDLISYPKLIFTRSKYASKNAYRFPSLVKSVLPADILMGFSYWRVNPVLWINNTFKD